MTRTAEEFNYSSLILAALPAAGLWCTVPGLTHFQRMCLVSMTLFFLIKAHVLALYVCTRRVVSWSDGFAWFTLWPGLNAPEFFELRSAACGRVCNRLSEWLFAAAKMLLGCVVFLLIAPELLPYSRSAAGWCALTGVLLTLHFGAFHLLALWWRSQGRQVRPIMNRPLNATSLMDFWSRRWNLAFRDYAHEFVFRPLSRRMPPVMAILMGYLFSGLIHELAVSLPAGSGFGLPTAYFLIQGAGIVTVRFACKRGLPLNSGFSGRIWTAAITALPVFLLFHKAFIELVVIPVIDR